MSPVVLCGVYHRDGQTFSHCKESVHEAFAYLLKPITKQNFDDILSLVDELISNSLMPAASRPEYSLH